MFKDNPKEVSKMMATAYNAVNMPLLFSKTESGFQRKLSELNRNPESKKSVKLGREFLQTIPMTTKTSSIADDFYARMVKKGFDAVLDTNDAYGLSRTQDPLIIFNMEKLGDMHSVKLTKSDLDSAFDYAFTKEFKLKNKDARDIAHSIV
jgi:hypothetical protein